MIAIIPARGGSKGVPRKNIKPLCGTPLIGWTIAEAKKSKYIDRCVISTEDQEIASIAKKLDGDVPFLRPADLAQDNTASIDVVLHVIDKLPGYEFVVLLQPTSPLRTVEDIDGVIAYCLEHNAASCVSITEAAHSPYWMYGIDDSGIMHPILKRPMDQIYQRQKLPKVYQVNGSVYVSSVHYLRQKHAFIGENTLGYIMPPERSWDIDTLLDFEFVEMLMKKQRKS